MSRSSGVRCGCGAIVAMVAGAMALGQEQGSQDLRLIVERLERLENQNRTLIEEVRSLRAELAAAKAPAADLSRQGTKNEGLLQVDLSRQATTSDGLPHVGERVAVQEARIEEQSQSKVESEHKLPVRLSGMLLFNAFLNGRASESMYPTLASLDAGRGVRGASIRQSVMGLKFDGPEIFGGGKITGSMFMDFFAGSGSSLNQLMRLRVASIDMTWKNTTVSVGQDKPIMAPREPESLAQVGLSPLTSAGNLWLWQPQARIEHRFSFNDTSGLRAQAGVFQTAEGGNGAVSDYPETLARARPGIEGRFEVWKAFAGGRRIEFAPSFHASNTLANRQSVPSRIYSVDWLIRPYQKFDFVGQYFWGENTGVIGGLHQGTSEFNGRLRSVKAYGGWVQVTYRATPRLSFNIYSGQEDDRNSDLPRDAVARNLIYAGNVMYRLGSNVLASFEASQVRTMYIGSGLRLNPHYDFALAYLF